MVSFNILLKDKGKFNLEAQIIKHIGKAVPCSLVSDNSTLKLPTQSYKFGTPNIQIGGDFYYNLNLTHVRKLSSGFNLFNSILGLLIAGRGHG